MAFSLCLDVLWSFVTPPHPEPPGSPMNLQSPLGGGSVPPVCALFAADHACQGHSRPRPAAPGPPGWLWELAAPSLRQREGCWKPLAVPHGLFWGGWHREPRFHPRDPSPSAGWRVQISPTPPPVPPSFHTSPRTSLSSHPPCGCPWVPWLLPSTTALSPTPAWARCLLPPRHLQGFAPTEDLSLKTSAWPRCGCRSLPVRCSAAVIPCSSCCCRFLSLQLVGGVPGSSGGHGRAFPGARQQCLGLVQQVPRGKASGEAQGCRTGHPPCRAWQGNRPFAAPTRQVKPLPSRNRSCLGSCDISRLEGVTWA